ncbi:MAG: PHP domain-containing protein [Clostridia bacterium]|nr:PHP domain-containing protein [Clostridia bacterium]
MPIMDIHSHTYYSRCGRDQFEQIIEAAIDGGVELFGISDHNYGVGDRIEEYRAKQAEMREKYKDRIRVLSGFEICTLKDPALVGYTYDYPLSRLEGFDYVLVENIHDERSVWGLDLPEMRKDFPCRVGIAHTDLIGLARQLGEDPTAFLRRFAEKDIFWEMNVSYDSIHNYREHAYVLRLKESEEEQEMVRRSGIRLSVGFDGHRVEDYRPDRVRDMCAWLEEKNLPLVEF